MTRRLALTGLAVLASLAFASACTQNTPSSTATTTPAKTATDTLNEAITKTNGQSYKYTVGFGDTVKGDGTLDSTGQNSQATTTVTVADAGVTVKINSLIVGGDIYVKLDLGPLTAAIPGLQGVGNKWLHIDKTKIGNDGLLSQYSPSEGSIGASSFVKGVVTAEKVSDTEIKGTIDLTKSAPGVLGKDQIATYGDAGKNVPFTATLDAQGRITKLVLNVPKAGALPAADLTTTYADYGATVTIAKPAAAEVVEAPDMLYTFLQ
jgi:hypothetical protein